MKSTKQTVTVIGEETEHSVEVISDAIVQIAASMKRINDTRLTRDAIVTLIHARSKVAKRDIELVLNNLTLLERVWLKSPTLTPKQQ